MDLYGYFARKDELIDLMADQAAAGAVLDQIPRHWRDALAAIAHALRAVCLAHPWVVTAAGRQPLIGPNVIRHVEQSLEATAALGIDWTKRLAIWRAVDSYTMGHAHLSPGRDHSEGTTANDPAWRAAAGAYLQDLAGSGNFPNLAAFGAAGLLHSKYDELTFETGLGWLLTGIAADTARSHFRRAAPQAATSTARSSPHSRGSGRGGVAAYEQHARGARRDLVSFVIEDARVVPGHRDASRARTHRTRPVGQEDVQHLGHADAVEDVDAEMRRPPLVQRAGQRLASRGTPYFRERSANMFGLGRAGSSTVAAPADSGKSTVFLPQAPGSSRTRTHL